VNAKAGENSNQERYLTFFKPEGSASGMVFNDKDELFVAVRNHVIKLTLKESL
jgi:hypothetical protein